MNHLLHKIIMSEVLIMISDTHKAEDLNIGPENKVVFDAAVQAAREVKHDIETMEVSRNEFLKKI